MRILLVIALDEHRSMLLGEPTMNLSGHLTVTRLKIAAWDSPTPTRRCRSAVLCAPPLQTSA